MNNIIELEDILFVFQQWIIIFKAEHLALLKGARAIELLDAQGETLGLANLGQLGSSRNPDIEGIFLQSYPIQVNMKSVRSIRIPQPSQKDH